MISEHYSMLIQWDDEDDIFVVSIPELKLKTHGKTYEEAVKQGKHAIEGWIEANKAWGRPIPPPRIAVSQSEPA